MSSLFTTPQNFQERLELAFRGSAQEQKETTKEFAKERRQERSRQFSQKGLLEKFSSRVRPKLGATTNIFKANLGGTNR